MFGLRSRRPLALVKLIIGLEAVETAAKESTDTCHGRFLAPSELPYLDLLARLYLADCLLSYVGARVTLLIILLNQPHLILLFVFMVKSLQLKIPTFRILLVAAPAETLLIIEFRQARNHSIEQFELAPEALLGVVVIHQFEDVA